ncbi:MAG TPA: STAS domain-containing protein [Pirellulales bacterium]|nr:STAS domain-containing protein [Pirellulales bacterium]
MMRLILLAQEGEYVRIESEGLATRDGADDPDSRFDAIGGDAIYTRKVLLDLSKCHYVDSMAIGWLLSCHRKFSERGGALVVHSPSPIVLQILKLMRMELVLHLAATEELARELARGAAHVD